MPLSEAMKCQKIGRTIIKENWFINLPGFSEIQTRHSITNPAFKYLVVYNILLCFIDISLQTERFANLLIY